MSTSYRCQCGNQLRWYAPIYILEIDVRDVVWFIWGNINGALLVIIFVTG